jgi:hypothetical protein
MEAREHLSAWRRPESYGGFSPDGDYLVLTRNRDSSLLGDVNFDVAVERLKAQSMDHGRSGDIPCDRPLAYTWVANHWAVGWVEYLMVRCDADESLLTTAGEIVCSLADYPILDESRYSAAEHEAVDEYWSQCSLRERAAYLVEADLSIFAARRDELPQDDNGRLYDKLSRGV